MSEETIRVLIIDDHTAIAFGMSLMLEQIPNIDVIGTASDGETGIEQVKTLYPDIVILDLVLPDMSGVEVTRRIKAINDNIRVVVYTGEIGINEYWNDLIDAGFDGLIHKREREDRLRRMIESVIEGCTILPIDVLHKMRYEDGQTDNQLRDTDLELLRYLVQGASNAEIAKAMFVSPKTVESHLTQLYRKLDVRSRKAACARAISLKLV